MSNPSSDKRPKLRDIVRESSEDFNRAWHTTEAASGFAPLPAGSYHCLIADGRLFTSRTNSTPGFKITFEVVDGPFAGRKIWHDVWLSPKALPMAKHELAKVGIVSPDQLEQSLPPGLIADVRVVLRTDDDGTSFNHVKRFEVVDATRADDFRPADIASTREREPGDDDDLDDDLDDDGFDWRTGEQVRQTSSTPVLDAARNGEVKTC